jgi:hypothetical protein
VGVPARWRSRLNGDFDAVRGAFLRARPEAARYVPCPVECGCNHEVVRHDDGSIVGVCRCEEWNCDDLPLQEEDVVLLELNWSRLGRAIATAFGCESKEASLGVPGVMQVGSFGGVALPVVLSIQHEPGDQRAVLAELGVRLQRPFAFLAPTGRLMDAHCHATIASARARFFDLESNLTVMPSGLLVAGKSAGEMFAALLPEQSEELGEDELRRIYARVLLTAKDEKGAREAPIKDVFDLYCLKAFSAGEVAVKLDCSKATVMNRLATLKGLAGVPAIELRAYKPFFERVESDLTDPRARRVRRKASAYGDDPSDERGEDR